MHCDNCGSSASIEDYNEDFDFWTCKHCGSVWSTGENDPDFEDDVPQAQEAIAERNIELLGQWQARD